MASERRNLYRLLHVQPEAPPEIIKSSYRTLMTALRAHPDLGGDHARAAQINPAYEVLSDPARRRAYDESLRAPVRGAAMSAVPRGFDPASWQATGRCPLCAERFAVGASRCLHCESPLAAAPSGAGERAELLGRRGGPRFARDQIVFVHRAGAEEQPARLRDLSLTGLSLVIDAAPPAASAMRVVAPSFDVVAQVVACRPSPAGHRVHARLLTMQLPPATRGVFVEARA